MESSCRILEDVLDVNIASWPALMGQEVSIVKNRKKKSTIAKIYPLTAGSGDPGHSLRGPTGSLRNVLSVFIESIRE
jgi:hypothetical protein